MRCQKEKDALDIYLSSSDNASLEFERGTPDWWEAFRNSAAMLIDAQFPTNPEARDDLERRLLEHLSETSP